MEGQEELRETDFPGLEAQGQRGVCVDNEGLEITEMDALQYHPPIASAPRDSPHQEKAQANRFPSCLMVLGLVSLAWLGILTVFVFKSTMESGNPQEPAQPAPTYDSTEVEELRASVSALEAHTATHLSRLASLEADLAREQARMMIPGPAGKDGNDGVPGPAGRDGKDGAQGPAGRDGNDGPPGPRGATGSPGRDGVCTCTGALYTGFVVVGDVDSNDRTILPTGGAITRAVKMPRWANGNKITLEYTVNCANRQAPNLHFTWQDTANADSSQSNDIHLPVIVSRVTSGEATIYIEESHGVVQSGTMLVSFLCSF